MIDLHYFPGNASLTPHLLLEELGTAYRLVLVDRAADAQNSAAYRKLNPNGKIPTLVDGDLVLWETAAIVAHLAETHPQAGFAPPPGSAARPHYLKWLAWLGSTLQSEMEVYFYPDRWADDAAGAAVVKAKAEARLAAKFDVVEAELARHGGPFLLGETFSALDPYLLMLGRWSRGMQRPARTLPALGPYLQRMLARPATQRVFAQEGITAPLV